MLLFVSFWHIFYAQSVDQVMESYQKDKDLAHASYGFCIADAATGKIIKEYNSELALIPASTQKIITTSAALGILGKHHTYKTNYYYANGTLTIKGSGDPSFNSTYFYTNDSLFFDPLIKKLKEKNITKIERLVIDAGMLNSDIPPTWIWSDIGNYFGASANGLSYADNKFSLYFTSNETGSFAKLEKIQPSYFKDKMTFESQVTAYGTEDNAFVFGDPSGYTRKVSGTIPPNKKNYEVEAQMPEPPVFYANQLISWLTKHNITVAGKPEIITGFKTEVYSSLIFTHQSPRLEKIVYYTNTKSNNHYAESLLNTVGAVKSGKQGTTDNGIDAVVAYWKERGIDVTGLHMVDGSGLSRANTLTTKLQTAILSKIYRDSTMYQAFNNSLPIAGKNGSMSSLCKGTFAENNMRAKTGYINRARGYCGYVKTKSGKELAFSVLFNNYDCSAKEAKLKIEKLLVAMTEL